MFVFHPAGGSTVVYEPLLKRLPPDTPMYGIERVEGSIEERAAEYVPKLLEMGGNGPFVLAGWSLGGVLAYACAIGLKRAGADVRFVGLIDAVRAGEEVPQTKEETRARWDRYARFAERTFNVEVPPIPYEQLENLDDEGQVQFVLDAVSQSGVQIPGGIIEHQRTSYLDNRVIDTAKIEPYDGHVTLYMADRYHDDAIFFEPRYATRKPDGGWGEFVSELEVVPIGGEHIQAIDEPYIAKVGAHMSEAIRITGSTLRRSRRSDRRTVSHHAQPRSWPNSARSSSWPRNPVERRPSPSGRRRAFRAPAHASMRWSTRAASWRSVRCARRRVTPTRCSATAWSPGTAPSTAGRSASSATTRRCSRARSARCSAARSPS